MDSSMITQGIQIEDETNNILKVELSDILEMVQDGGKLHWAILYLEVLGPVEKDISVPKLEKKINQSPQGMLIAWEEIISLAKKIFQIIDLVLIGSHDLNQIRRYKDDQEMYESCDIVIVMFDSSYWEVFSKDKKFIEKLNEKFANTKLLESDSLKKEKGFFQNEK